MTNAMNLYFTDEDRSKMEVVRKALASKGIKFTDKRGNESTSALLRYLVDEKVRELKTLSHPLNIGG